MDGATRHIWNINNEYMFPFCDNCGLLAKQFTGFDVNGKYRRICI